MAQTRHAPRRKKTRTKAKTFLESSVDVLDIDLDRENEPFYDDELVTLDEFETLSTLPKLVDEESPKNRQRIDPPTRTQGPRKKVVRRRQIDPSTCERDYSTDEVEFMNALSEYKRSSGRMFPTCSEILEVLKNLGYEKCVSKAETSSFDADQPLDSEELNVENRV